MLVPLVLAAGVAAPPPPVVRAVSVQDSPIVVTIRVRRGTKGLVCALDAGRAKACGRDATFKASAGRHTVTVRAVGASGRKSAARRVTVFVPTRAPKAVRVGGDPVGVSAANGVVWVSAGSAGTVAAVNAVSRRVVATVHTGGDLGSILATKDAVWVSNYGGGTVFRIDPASHEVVARIPVGGQPSGIALDAEGKLWVGNLGGYITRIDPATAKTTRVTLPSGVSQPISARGLLWCGLQNGAVVALDPTKSAVTGAAVPVAPDVDALVDTPNGLWVSTFAGTAALVDPVARRVRRRYSLPSRGGGISYARGSVWVSAYDSRLVVRLDAATGRLLGAVHTGEEPRESVVAGGVLWVANQLDGTVTPIAIGS